jgi:hypothetical protein
MDLNSLLLAIACATSLPSAGLMLRHAQDGRSSIEMAVGAAICTGCFGLVLAQSPIGWLAAALALSAATYALVKRRETRWPLLLLALLIFLVYLDRTAEIITS